MATDYILFIHGVNTREKNEPPTYADGLFKLIQDHITKHSSEKPDRNLVKVPLYWGSVAEPAENELLKEYTSSSQWKKFWYTSLRGGAFLGFSGDIALYLSRYFGAKVADKLKDDALKALPPPASLSPDSEDRLHLIAHSMGTIILFDILFSARWDQEGIPGHDSVIAIRDVIYGVEPQWEKGIRLASLTTMGAPLGLFSLMDVDKSEVEKKNDKGEIVNTHDITPRLQQMLDRLSTKTGGERKKLPWLNFAHPGDPLASPLVPLMPNMVDGERKYIDVEDIVLKNARPTDYLGQLLSNTPLAILHAGGAHLSYLSSPQVAEKIAETILEASKHTKPVIAMETGEAVQ